MTTASTGCRFAQRGFCRAFAAALLMFGAAPPASADFAPPAVVANERTFMTPSVSGAPDGSVALAWTRLDSSFRGVEIRLAVRGPGAAGQFGAPETLAADSANHNVAAIGSNGHVAVVWTGSMGGLFVRRRAPDGALGAVEPLFAAPSYTPYKPAIGVDDAGNTIVAWTGEDGSLVQRWAPAGQPFGAPQPVRGSVDVAPSLAITGTGRALVGFSAAATVTPAPADARAALVVTSRLDGALGAARQLAAGAVPAARTESGPQLAVAQGRVLAVWTRTLGAVFPGGQTMTAALDANGVASAQRTVYSGYFIQTGADLGARRAVVGWVDPSSGTVGGVVGDDAASFAEPFAANTTESVGIPITAGADSAGNAVLMWTHKTGGGTLTEPEVNEVRTATIPHERTVPCGVRAFGSGRFGHPALVMDGAGGGLAVWSEHVAGSILAARWSATPTTCADGGGAGAAGPAAGRVALTATRTTVRVAPRPVVRVKLRCAATVGCRGPATLKAGTLTLASGRLKLAAGKRGTLVLTPGSDRARRRLRRPGSLSATLGLKLAVAGVPSQRATLAVRLRIRR